MRFILIQFNATEAYTTNTFRFSCSIMKSRVARVARGIISLPIYTFRNQKQSAQHQSHILRSISSPRLKQPLAYQDWQCLASTLTLSTKTVIRSSYWLTCPLTKSWPCLRISSEETSISSSCSFSVLDVAYHRFMLASTD